MQAGWIFKSILMVVISSVTALTVFAVPITAQEATGELEVCATSEQEAAQLQLTASSDQEACEEQVVAAPEVDEAPIKGEPSPETVAGTNEELAPGADPAVLGASTDDSSPAVLAATGSEVYVAISVGVAIIAVSVLAAKISHSRYIG